MPDSLAQSASDLYAVIINVAVNAWMAGHIHGEDGCPGCDGSRYAAAAGRSTSSADLSCLRAKPAGEPQAAAKDFVGDVLSGPLQRLLRT